MIIVKTATSTEIGVMTATPIDRLTKELAAYSRKSHLIALCLVAEPALIGIAWIIFPFLEARNLGYPVWHFSCILGFLIAGFGVACWIAERLSAGRSSSLIALLFLLGICISAIVLRFVGDFYWAFDRGYFLN